jgi:hypothetical protein
MKAATLGRSVLVSLAVLLVAGNGIATVSASTPTSQPLLFTVPSNLGTVQNLGDQTYAVGGGHVVSAVVGGTALDPGATITFSLNARVIGPKITGSASFDLQGTISGVPVSASGRVAITGRLTLAQIAQTQVQACSGPGGNACGVLPVLFGGASIIQVTVAGVGRHDLTVFYVENPYFNPFGAPIVLASSDGAVVIAATYDLGTIHWQGSMVGGPMIGVLGGSTPVSGSLGLTSTEEEDLVAGTAVDNGTITFSSMRPSFLDLSGTYAGTSYIPAPSPLDDCSKFLGFPAGSGVCTMTGFDSAGRYVMKQDGTLVVGQYSTTWTVPALAFTSTSHAIVTR